MAGHVKPSLDMARSTLVDRSSLGLWVFHRGKTLDVMRMEKNRQKNQRKTIIISPSHVEFNKVDFGIKKSASQRSKARGFACLYTAWVRTGIHREHDQPAGANCIPCFDSTLGNDGENGSEMIHL